MMRYYLLRLIRVKDNRASVQRGVAIGIAVHSIPLFGFSLLAGLAFAFPFRASKAAVTLANLMSAPLTLPIYSLNFIFAKLFFDRLKIVAGGLGLSTHLAFLIGTIGGIVAVFVLLYALSYVLASIAFRLLERHLADQRKERRASRAQLLRRSAVVSTVRLSEE
ncbi:MAG: DUF2062 domain-containing protein [Hydrogenibacillus sp.]|nr:DUF2062 domain-containing protein [Hydrogenibacillus sp.]